MAKLSIDQLRKYVFSRTGAPDPDVLRVPGVGEDAAVVRLSDDLYLVSHTDPITAATHNLGRLAIYVSSNDIAVKGVRPRYALVTLLLKDGTEDYEIDEITAQMHRSALELGISLVGGHTEIVSRLRENIAIVTQIGISRRKPLDIKEIRDGDLLLQVNEAGIEGTAVIAYDHPDLIVQFDEGGLELAMSYMERVSVVRDALRLSELGVRAMHDPTEGGLIGGAVEMAVASGLSLEVDYDKVLISPITRSICEHLGLDPLKLLSSGSVLAAAERQVAEAVLREYGERASIIGRFTRGPPGLILKRNDRSEIYTEPPQDEIYRLI